MGFFLECGRVRTAVREVEGRLGIADGLDRAEDRVRDDKCGRLGQTNILARENHHSTRDEERVFTGRHHAREVVKRRVRLGCAH